MSTKLSVANPHLRDPVQRQRSVFASVATSSAIEGIRAPFKGRAGAALKRLSGSVTNAKSRRSP